MKEKFVKINNLSVDKILLDFVNNELLRDTEISSEKFWEGFDKAIHELAPKNKELLEIRETLQKEIDLWHKKNKSENFDQKKYRNFLKEINYLKEEGPDFTISTENLDPEISNIAGPQLVVPIMNARYSLNAANARCREQNGNARGGIFNKPTYGMFGEAGAEALVPLEKNKRMGERILQTIIPEYYPELMQQTGGIYGSNMARTTNYNTTSGDSYGITGPVTVISNDPVDFTNKLKEQYRVSTGR